MSRFEWDNYDNPDFAQQEYFFETNARRALAGKKGRKALAELKEALEALPEKRLIEGALCEVTYGENDEISNGSVCAVGAYIWWKKVKAGADPLAVFEEMDYMSEEGDPFGTAWAGKNAGLPGLVAWELASANDETWGGLSPEERYNKFIEWIDKRLALPELKKGDPLPPRIGRSWAGGL